MREWKRAQAIAEKALNEQQRQVIDTLKTRITNMREGGRPDNVIRAQLLSPEEGWPVAAVDAAMEELSE